MNVDSRQSGQLSHHFRIALNLLRICLNIVFAEHYPNLESLVVLHKLDNRSVHMPLESDQTAFRSHYT